MNTEPALPSMTVRVVGTVLPAVSITIECEIYSVPVAGRMVSFHQQFGCE